MHAENDGSPEMVAASIGPFYESDDAARHLNVSVAEIKRLATCADVLAVTTGDGTQLYPTWQFTDEGTTLPGLVPVLTVLLKAADAWTAAIWLNAPSERLDGKSAVEVLQATHDSSDVCKLAAEDAARWAT